ncbi:MAG: hypothetical protein H0V89_07175 [Deltaproteobacteria bacterium]|nr:hypothetical protein [Deltaproteobacteria bacterium]
MGILDAHDSDLRGLNDAAMFRALYDHFELTGFLVGDGGRLVRRDGEGGVVALGGQGTPQSTMVLDATGVTARALAPGPGPWDPSLHAVGLTGVALHILFTDGDGRAWDLDTRRVVTP